MVFMKKILYILIFILLCNPVSAVSIIPVPESKWTCYDYSTNFAKENSEWGIVLIGYNQVFRGVSHFVNYQVIDEDTLLIHDDMIDEEYKIFNWQLDTTHCYHFYVNGENPRRHYDWMRDNRYVLSKYTF